MFDRIPFGSAGRVMGNGYSEPKAVAELALKFGFPGVGAATVAAACIRQDEQLPTAAVALSAVALPPTSDGVDGKGCRIMRDAHEDRASVGQQVIDTVRDGYADGIGTEIVVIDADWRTDPLHTIILEVADQFSFFGIDTDDGKALALKACT